MKLELPFCYHFCGFVAFTMCEAGAVAMREGTALAMSELFVFLPIFR